MNFKDEFTAEDERRVLHESLPSEWIANVSNSGKIFALYDKTQVVWN